MLNMFKRRDIPPVLLLLVLIILVMLTLSQILVVHNGRYGKNVHNMRKLQLELREMDINLHTMMMQNVPSIELSRRLLQNEINSQRVANIIAEASKPDKSFVPLKKDDSDEVSSYFANENSMDYSKSDLIIDLLTAKIDDQDTYLNEIRTDRVNSSIKTKLNNVNISETVHNNSVDDLQAPYCPPVPPNLTGHIFIDFEHKHDYSESEVIEQNKDLLIGGAWKPNECVARHKVAIIIPYRDRKEHLIVLLSHLHVMLQRQQLDYRIYVIEQNGEFTFNKARIMNIAFVEALKQYNFQCFVFHDVDLVPEDDRNMYSCPMQPRHMSVAIDEMGYKLAYQELVGGVLNMRTEHFQRVNGYSNLYWGWGAEDDDMAYRIMYVGLKITRPPDNVARYKMIRHTKRKPSDWRKRAKLLYTGTRRFQFDGLNSLQYKLVSIQNNRLFTHILVDIGKPPRGF